MPLPCTVSLEWAGQRFNFSGTGALREYVTVAHAAVPKPAGRRPGAQFMNDVQHVGDLHTRDTDLGQYRVVCRAGRRYADGWSSCKRAPSPAPATTQPKRHCHADRHTQPVCDCVQHHDGHGNAELDAVTDVDSVSDFNAEQYA